MKMSREQTMGLFEGEIMDIYDDEDEEEDDFEIEAEPQNNPIE